jgi:hypothetical protein
LREVLAVAEAMPTAIAKLVYLGAYLPADGQSLFDLGLTDADSHLGPVLQVDQAAGLARIPAASLEDLFVADGSPAAIAKLQAQYRDEPLLPLVTPIHLTAASWGVVPKAYVYTREDHAISYGLQQRMTAGIVFASSVTIDTSHSPFLSQPALVVSTLSAF